ncbi:hypothetical protein CCHL11_09410 [Colletotrichum chlorophyti]|uniref:Zonadhesin n=1 Tax=Colletotrichum chlorophyti TaxID=708187 RepID=A0A1Q8R9J4_9PEZI|nr:hypothetical protein CCHL11_09410 [Colletotrichum chlorophyti]
MHQPPPAEQSTFESQVQYNLQATEDFDEEQPELEKKRYLVELPERPNYRPKPLRWPFIACMILLLSVLMGLVIFARETMPNSDSTATIEPRHMLHRREDVNSSGQPISGPTPSAAANNVKTSEAAVAASPTEVPTSAVAKIETSEAPVSTSQAQAAAPSSNVVEVKTSDVPISSSIGAVPNTPTPTFPLSSRFPVTTEPERPATSASSAVLPDSNTAQSSTVGTASRFSASSSTGSESRPSVTSSISTDIFTTSSQALSGSLLTSLTDKSISISTVSIKTTSTGLQTTSSDLGNRKQMQSTQGAGSLTSSDGSGRMTTSTNTSSATPRKPTGSDEIETVITSKFTSTITRPGSTYSYSSNIVTSIFTSFTSTFTSTIPGTTGESTFTTVKSTTITRPFTPPPPPPPQSSETGEATPTEVPEGTPSLTTEIMETTIVTTSRFTSPPVTTAFTSVIASAVPTTIATFLTTTDIGQVYVSVGTTEITRIITISGGNRIQQLNDPTPVTQVITSVLDGKVVTVVDNGAPQTIVTNDGGVFTLLYTPSPQTIVTQRGGQETQVVVTVTPSPNVAFVAVPTTIDGTPTAVMVETTLSAAGSPRQVVTMIDGKPTVINATPTPETALVAVQTTVNGKPTVVMVQSVLGGEGLSKQVATTIDGKATVMNVPVTAGPVMVAVQTTINGKATVVEVPMTVDPYLVAVETTINGKPTVALVRTTPTPAGFLPVSLTLVSQVGGSTGVFMTTDDPETIKTTIDGKETTIIRTPAPRVFTSVVGGTPTTIEVVTTPTGSIPLSFTVITTIGGTPSTIVSTPKPTVLTMTISGKLSTITSTPKPTTRLSTIKPVTTTITSISNPTPTDAADTVIMQVEKFGFTDGDYFVGKFLPVILAVLIRIPLRIIDLNAKMYQPFHAMAKEGGSLGKSSITLQFDGWAGFFAPVRVLMQGHPVPFITELMVWSSSLLAPLSTEAIGMKLHGRCRITAIAGCGIQLGVSTMSAHALVAVLAFIIVLLLVLLLFLRSWETGLYANPWSIVGISSLVRNSDIRSKQIEYKRSKEVIAEKRYGIGYSKNSSGRDEYGIIYEDDSAESLQAAASGALPVDDELDGTYQRDIQMKQRKPVPFIALTYWWRLIFLFFLSSLCVIILYYHISLSVRTSFKDFMDSQSFGVRFFFAALGIIIIFCWESIFVSIAIISPYYHMGRRPQPPENSILLSRPTNSFYGIYAAVVQGDIILMLAALMSILAEFLPILLANVPYNLTQTLKSHDVCAIMSATILGLMALTIVASFFIKWPEMPADPRSIAGAMYYVNESRMLEDFEGLSKLNSKDREQKVKELGRRYFYGSVTGNQGRRMGVESVESVEDTAYTGGHWFLPPIQEEHHEHSDQSSENEQHAELHQPAQGVSRRETACNNLGCTPEVLKL